MEKSVDLQLGFLAGSSGSDETGRISLRVVDRHVLTFVINVELGHVNTDIVLVGKSIRDFSNFGILGQDLLLHEVKSGLNGSRIILGKSVTGDLLNTSVDSLVVDVTESSGGVGRESPLTVNRGGEDTVPSGF